METAPGDAILRSENDELIQWAIDLFEEYQSTAYPALDRLDGPLLHADLKDLRRLVQNRIPGYAESDC